MGSHEERLWIALGMVVAFILVSVLIPGDSFVDHLVLAVLIGFPVMGVLYAGFVFLQGAADSAREKDEREKKRRGE
jgi:hypothetical protein